MPGPELSYRFTFPLPHGLHARPASKIAEAFGVICPSAILVNERSEAKASCCSVLELVACSVVQGDSCVIHASSGDDLEAVRRYIVEQLPYLDSTIEECTDSEPKIGRLPHLLRKQGIRYVSGRPLSPGIRMCRALEVIERSAIPVDFAGIASAPAEQEWQRFISARAAVRERLKDRLRFEVSAAQEILSATLALLDDPGLDREVESQILTGSSAALAVSEVMETFVQRLRRADSAYLRERVIDLLDIKQQLLIALGIAVESTPLPVLETNTLVAVESLTVSELLSFDRDCLAGLALGSIGQTSHVAILARSLGIPAVADLDLKAIPALGSIFVIDGDRGLVLSGNQRPVAEFYTRQRERIFAIRSSRSEGEINETYSVDGQRIEIAANATELGSTYQGKYAGAEGIGLLRTELLLAGFSSPPTEQEQFELYSEIVQAMEGRTVIIRTLDVGGDKPLPWLPLPREDNPFLGWRGARIYEAHPEIIDTQLHAICRASALGPLRVMAPMISSAAEAQAFRERVLRVQQQLQEKGEAFDPAMPIGAMIEIPAAALGVRQLAQHCDFFSIGTNDLAQYALAVDRGNQYVVQLCDLRHPGFLRLLKTAVDEARAAGRWIGMCGEMAGETDNAPLLVGLGLDEISMAATSIPAMKAAVSRLDSERCRELLIQAIDSSNAEEVGNLLVAFSSTSLPLLDSSLIQLDVEASAKPEALRLVAELLEDQGRVVFADDLEDALHDREETYSTGLGHGFAVPHCKSACVKTATLALLRLAEPIEWGSLDNQPVDTVITLAMPEVTADQHLRVFARLARKLMHEDFRHSLRTLKQQDEIMDLLNRELELTSEV